jgi:hypothetical protein
MIEIAQQRSIVLKGMRKKKRNLQIKTLIHWNALKPSRVGSPLIATDQSIPFHGTNWHLLWLINKIDIHPTDRFAFIILLRVNYVY